MPLFEFFVKRSPSYALMHQQFAFEIFGWYQLNYI